MISNDMASRMNAQVNMELYSAYFYLALSSRAESGSLRGVSDWFMAEQIGEEATVSEVLGRLRLFGDKPEGLLMLDKELSGMAATMAQAGAIGPTVAVA